MVKYRIHLLGFAFVLCIVYWVFQSLLDVLIFEKPLTLINIFYPNFMAFWIRILWVCFAILVGSFAQSRLNKIEDMKVVSIVSPMKPVVVLASVGFASLYWIIEAVRDVYVFHKENIITRIFLPDTVSLLERLSASLLFLMLGIYAQSIIVKRIREKATAK